jgi:hypothetical protein
LQINRAVPEELEGLLMRIARLVVANFMLFTAGAAVAQAAGTPTFRIGDVDGANATFVFDGNARPPVIILRTARAGVAGSRIEVTVDQAKEPVFRHIFAPEECKFGEGGSAEAGSTCEVTISEKGAAYRAILTRFKRGHLARVTVQDAGVMKMDQTASLKGFAKLLH